MSRLEEFTALLVRNSNSLDELLDTLLSRLVEERGFDFGVVVQFQDEQGSVSHYVNRGVSLRLVSEIEALSRTETMLLNPNHEQNVFIHQVPRQPNKKLKNFIADLRTQHLASGFSLIMKAQDRIWGILHFWHREKLELTPPEIAEYEAIGRIFCFLIENHKLRIQNQPGKKSNTRKLIGLNNIISILNQENDLNGVLTNTLQETLNLLHLTAGGIYLIDEPNQSAVLVTYIGLPLELVNKIKNLNMNHLDWETIMRAGQTLVTIELPNPSLVVLPLPNEYGIKRMVTVPLKVRNQIPGFVHLTVPPLRHFSEDEIYFLDSIRNQLGMMVENLRLSQRIQLPVAKFAPLSTPDKLYAVG